MFIEVYFGCIVFLFYPRCDILKNSLKRQGILHYHSKVTRLANGSRIV